MKKEDLRIGNYYYDSVRDRVIKLELKHFAELSISEEMFFKRYKPINIDDRLCFIEHSVLNKEHMFKVTNSEFNEVFEKSNGIYFYTGGEGVRLSNGLIYIHQLQNCIYGLGYGEIITI